LGYDCIDDNYDIGYYEYQELMLDQNDIDFGDIPIFILSEGIQVSISNISEEDIFISSIEASEHFLIKQNLEDEYTDQIGSIDLSADSELFFWIACHPYEEGIINGEIRIQSNGIPSEVIISTSANCFANYILKLYNNCPNPFNTETTISFSIPQGSNIQLIIYNIKGQKVRTLIDAHCDKGINSVIWNGTDENGKYVGSGVYFYSWKVDGKTRKNRKMLLLK